MQMWTFVQLGQGVLLGVVVLLIDRLWPAQGRRGYRLYAPVLILLALAILSVSSYDYGVPPLPFSLGALCVLLSAIASRHLSRQAPEQ